MLFKKKKGAPPPERETPSPEAQATTKQILEGRPDAEQRKYFHDTATSFYRI